MKKSALCGSKNPTANTTCVHNCALDCETFSNCFQLFGTLVEKSPLISSIWSVLFDWQPTEVKFNRKMIIKLNSPSWNRYVQSKFLRKVSFIPDIRYIGHIWVHQVYRCSTQNTVSFAQFRTHTHTHICVLPVHIEFNRTDEENR